MSVVGVDLGNLNTVIAVARRGGIDVICNEVSNRATPSLVAFTPKSRFIGESAKSQEVSNLKNTVGSFKLLIGRTINDPLYAEELRFLNYRTEPLKNSSIGVKVNYLSEERVFSPTEITAMFLGKVKEITCHELSTQAVSEIVLSCPVYFTDPQRRALIDAAEIAGLKVVRLLNDTTAAAIGYGKTKVADLNDETARTVCFVNMGHSSYSVSIVSFWATKMEVKSVAYDQTLGGRIFDEVLADAIAEEIRETRRVDIRSSPKAMYRLRLAAERAKKILSANSKTAVHVESITEDQDYATDFTRERFDGLISGLLERVEIPIRKALNDAGIAPEAIHSIELIGGSVRIPAVKERISKIFGNREPSTTMNQDEAVARGCAWQAAMLSPSFKSRHAFNIQDSAVIDIRFEWEPTAEEPDDRDAVVFPAGNPLPSTKLLSFSRPLPFDIRVWSEGTGDFAAATIGPSESNAVTVGSVIKVKAKMSLCHTISIESAQIIEESVVVDSAGTPTSEGGDQPKKKVQKKIDIPVTFVHTGLPNKQIEQLREQEGSMVANDRLVRDTADCLNALESYIYDARSKIEMEWSNCANDKEKQTLCAQLEKTESWLYSDDHHDHASKSVYVEKLNALKSIGDPIMKRHLEEEARPKAIVRLRDQISQYAAFADDRSAKYEHITEDDRNIVRRACADAENTISGLLAKQSNLKPWDKPVLTSTMVDTQREKLINIVAPITLKPKPAPPTPSPSAQSGSEAKTNTSNPSTQSTDIPEMEMDL